MTDVFIKRRSGHTQREDAARTQRDDHPQAEERPQEQPALSTPHLGLLDARSEKKMLLKPPDLCRFAMAALANYHSLALPRLCSDLSKGFLVSFTVVFISVTSV